MKPISLNYYWLLLPCLLLIGCHAGEIETIVIRGSDTEVNVVLQLAENYMNVHPDVSIAVTGGGSGTGIAALINGRTDIANASRAFKPAELRLAKERSIDVLPIIFAIDALIFIVHESFPIEALTLAQIRSIFSGDVNQWEEVGGPQSSISLYGRQPNSGTFTYIQSNILKGDYSTSMKQMNGTSQIIESIRNDPAGIGYVGIGYVQAKDSAIIPGIKVLDIITSSGLIISPMERENIIDGSYPIVRPLFQYLDGIPLGKLRDFIDYELSEYGQYLISKNGYFPISSQQHEINQNYLNNVESELN